MSRTETTYDTTTCLSMCYTTNQLLSIILPATIFIKKLQVLLYVDFHKMLRAHNLAVQNIDILKNFIHNLLTFCEQEN